MDSKKANTVKRLHVIIERIELQRTITLWCVVFAVFVMSASAALFSISVGTRYVTGFMVIAMGVYIIVGTASRRNMAEHCKTIDDLITGLKEQSN